MGLDVDGEGTALEALVPLAQHARRLLATAAARPVVLQKMKYLIEDRQIGCVAKTNIEMTTTTVMWCCKDGLITNETECKKVTKRKGKGSKFHRNDTNNTVLVLQGKLNFEVICKQSWDTSNTASALEV